MKHKFLNKLLLLLLCILGGASSAWADETYTFNASVDVTENAQSYQTTEKSYTASDGSVWKANGYGATANTNIVIGKGGANYLRTPEVPEGYKITSVAVTWSGNTSHYLALQTTSGTELEAKSNPSTATEETFTVSLGTYRQLQLVGRRSSGTSNAAATITKVVVTYISDAPAYSISAVSNNDSYGTVSLSGSVITGSPKNRYRYADPAYTVSPANSATVVQNGNEFSVTPSANTTVTINFEAIPTHTATFFVNGNTSRTATVAEGSAISFPTAVATPSDATEIPEEFNGKTFVGWFTEEYTHATDAPAYVNTSTTTMGNEDVTYYAVYADVVDGESDNVEDAVKAQTLQYDTWSYSGSTTDKSSYRLFHSNSYIESASFDLSKLIKVVVKGGTFGGDSYNSLTIGDGTNTWKNVTVSGNSATGTNTYTGGTALTGTNKLRITCNSGTASSTGVRISQVDIYVKGTVRTESNYTTDARTAADISFANSEVNVKLSSGYTGQALTNPNSLTVAYSSSDATVATVNSSTGITELLKAGTTTITATFDGDATYKSAEVSYDLIVTEKTPHGLVYAVTEVEKLTTDAAFTNTLTNDNSLTVSYSSSETDVATVNASTGEVTIQGAGSATITATFAGNEDYEAGDASYTLTVSKATPTLSFASDNAIGRIGETFEGNELTNPANLTVSYNSSTTSVATVNVTTGAITIVAAGTTTITASSEENETFTSGSASYTLKVLAAPTFTLNDDEVAYGETFTVDESKIEGGAITVTSGNMSVATVEGLVITPVSCGEVEITVSTAENETYKAGSKTFILTVTSPEGKTTAPSSDVTYTFDFTDNTNWGFPVGSSNKTTESNSYTADGRTITLSGGGSGNGYYFNASGYLMLGKSGATLTLPAFDKDVTRIDVKMTSGTSSSVTVNVFVGDDEVSSQTTGGSLKLYTINETKRTAGTIYSIKVTNGYNAQVEKITVHMYQAPTETVTLNTSGYATFCSEYPLDFSEAEANGYSAWQITAANSSTGVITFSKITGSVKGGTGILLKGTASTTVTLTSADSSNELDDNLLYGTLAPTYVAADQYYGLAGNQFKKVNAGTVPAGKALLPASALDSNVKAFTFVFEEDDATGISLMEDGRSMMEDGVIFNLAGQRISKMQKGINIVNGKKVLK